MLFFFRAVRRRLDLRHRPLDLHVQGRRVPAHRLHHQVEGAAVHHFRPHLGSAFFKMYKCSIRRRARRSRASTSAGDAAHLPLRVSLLLVRTVLVWITFLTCELRRRHLARATPRRPPPPTRAAASSASRRRRPSSPSAWFHARRCRLRRRRFPRDVRRQPRRCGRRRAPRRHRPDVVYAGAAPPHFIMVERVLTSYPRSPPRSCRCVARHLRRHPRAAAPDDAASVAAWADARPLRARVRARGARLGRQRRALLVARRQAAGGEPRRPAEL